MQAQGLDLVAPQQQESLLSSAENRMLVYSLGFITRPHSHLPGSIQLLVGLAPQSGHFLCGEWRIPFSSLVIPSKSANISSEASLIVSGVTMASHLSQDISSLPNGIHWWSLKLEQ